MKTVFGSGSFRGAWVMGVILALSIVNVHANEKRLIPDFYGEPGRNSFRDQVSFNVTEHIDPLSGNLHLTYTDLFLPGDGGLDLRVLRSYDANSVYVGHKTPTNLAPNLTTLSHRTPTGLGWTLHFGRVLKTHDQSTGKPHECADTGLGGVNNTLDNAILELPDGRKTVLFVNATSFSTTFISKEQWVATCLANGAGFFVISPQGVKYTMNYRRVGPGPVPTDPTITHYAYYTTRIEDRNGNSLTISYDTAGTTHDTGLEPVFKEINASDGRRVTFGYRDRTNSRIRLDSISAHGQTWSYGYSAVNDSIGDYFYLTDVTTPSPNSMQWRYRYYANRAAGSAGHRILQEVTYPYGATVNYDYEYKCFNSTAEQNYTCTSANNFFNSLVVISKSNGGRDVVAGTWNYNYAPGTAEDVTTVTFPGGRHVYRHFGTRTFAFGSTLPVNTLWRVGLLKSKEIYNGTTLVHSETYTWQNLYKLSNEFYMRPPYDGEIGIAKHDQAVWAPVLTRKDIVRDSTTYTTTYDTFDASFNPTKITEDGQRRRVLNLTYFPRVAGQNIVSLIKDEDIDGGGLCLPIGSPECSFNSQIGRSFDANGNLRWINRFGVREDFTYYGTGDVATRTDAEGRQWTFSGYKRGIPQQENHPEGVQINRAVNDTGTIASETNGRRFATSYGYDGLNRVTGITKSRGTPITVAWGSTARTVSRGSYSRTTTFDGFGRPSFFDTRDTATGAIVTQDINYNVLGYKSFESYFSSSQGDVYSTDILGRVTQVSHQGDGTALTTAYLSGNRVRVTNERGFQTTYTYRSFGDPADEETRVLMQIDAPEGVSTVFARNLIGMVNQVTQGGVTRGYTYNANNNFLHTESNPETGTTTYGRDGVGNMTSRQIGGSAVTTFGYDGLDRLRTINYPGTTPDVTMTYDENNNLKTVVAGISRRSYDYDENDNLTQEQLILEGQTYTLAYAINALDHVQSLTYPSGDVVTYAPNALGRPSQIAPHVTSVSYHPNGVPSSLTYANGRTTTHSLNNRQWIANINVTGGAMDLTYAYDGLANIQSITDGVDPSANRSMSYDGLDRLTTSNGVWGIGSTSYYASGNINTKTIGASSLTFGYTNNRLSSVSGSKSYAYSYDDYGNILGNGSFLANYDDASDLRAITIGSNVAYHDYDGQNYRVKTEQDGKTTNLFYNKAGNLFGEYSLDAVYERKEYAYLGSRLVALNRKPQTVPASITVPVSDGDGSYTIAWQAPPVDPAAPPAPARTYELYESTDANFTNVTLVTPAGYQNLSYTVTGRIDGTYYYRIRTCETGSCSAYRTGQNGVTVTGVPPSADLFVDLFDASDPWHIDARHVLWFRAEVSNYGPSSASNVLFQQITPSPAVDAYAASSSATVTCSRDASKVNCDTANLPAGATFTVFVALDPQPSDVGTITSTATISSTTSDPNTLNNTSREETIVLLTVADLSVTVRDTTDPLPVNAGQGLWYETVVSNNSVSDVSGVSLTQTLPTPALQISTASPGVTCNATTTQMTCNRTDMAGGGTFSVWLQLQSPSVAGSVSTTAQVSGLVDDPNPANNSATETTTITPANDVDLAVIVSPSITPFAGGGAWVWHWVGVTNWGPTAAANVTMTETVTPAQTVLLYDGYVSTPPNWSCSVTANQLNCNRLADMPANHTEWIGQWIYIAPGNSGAQITGTATLGTTSNDTYAPNNSSTATVGVP